jgi:perosamine synthetase
MSDAAFIPQMEPWFDDAEADAVHAYMKSGGWVTEFQKTRDFEEQIAAYTGAAHCSIVCNGTIALVLALHACGIGPGDEVVVPDYTMVASANAVRLAGAEVAFVDVSPTSLCLDFERLVDAAGPRTRAVMLVSINGRYPPDLEKMVAWCRERGLRVIEDAAQSLGSRKGGRHLGTFGDLGVLSFSAAKIITTGQGGAIVTDDAALIDRVRALRDFGRLQSGVDRYVSMGWNAKFTDLQAVVGLEQMKKLPARVERKKAIYARYRRLLGDVPGVELVPTNLEDTAPWFVDLLVATGLREALARHLRTRDVGTRPFYPALHSEPVYGVDGHFPVAERVARDGLWLPSSSRLTDDDVARVCAGVREFFRS